MKITLNVLSVAAAFGLAASAQAQTTLFSTDFENHTLGADNLAGTDNWGTNAVNSGVQGIKAIGGNQFGYLGEASPAANFTEVYQSTPYDPVGQGEPIVNISMDLAIFDSTNFEYDVFFVDIYNQDTDLLVCWLSNKLPLIIFI